MGEITRTIKVNTDFIKSYMKEHNLNVKQFCAHCRISITVYYKLMHNKQNLSLETALLLTTFLNIKTEELFILCEEEIND